MLGLKRIGHELYTFCLQNSLIVIYLHYCVYYTVHCLQNSLIASYLSYCDYYRAKFFLR